MQRAVPAGCFSKETGGISESSPKLDGAPWEDAAVRRQSATAGSRLVGLSARGSPWWAAREPLLTERVSRRESMEFRSWQ